ncbi:hypothetical protein FDF74_08360 [Clostridium niameyense]|uniref:Uncharacterized protein n=1 Tax=Clostridium niameyense TaxID=1622073 RepID=A0A6M0RC12_9CLOT|nr:hypothetical protein [Clostridium niameyense]NEZ47220.1 hypothetical protein [Clostridium niameyense]
MSIRLDINNLSNKIHTNTYNKESHKVNNSFKSVIDEVKKGPFPLYEKKAEDIDFKFLSNAPSNVKKAWNTTWNSLDSRGRMELIIGMIELKYMNHKYPNTPINNVKGYKDVISLFLDDMLDMNKSVSFGGDSGLRKNIIDTLMKFQHELSKYN